MFSRVSAALLVVLAFVGLPIWAETTTQPSQSALATTNPSSDATADASQSQSQAARPAARNTNSSAATPAQPGSGNSAQPNRPGNDNSAPSPAAIAQRLRQAAAPARPNSDPRFAYFDLSGVTEKPADFSWFGSDSGVTLHGLIDRLEKARNDTTLRGILVTLRDPGLNLSQALEIRSEFRQLHMAGKRVFVYADEYDTDSYIAACGADDICMLGGGDIMIPGVGFQLMFYKNLMEKLGVNADYVQIGEYKGAQEEYTRSQSSPEFSAQLNTLADSIYDQIVQKITESRPNLSNSDVKELMDQSLITGKVAKDRGLVDHLVDIDQVPQMIGQELSGRHVELVRNYGEGQQAAPDLSNPFALLSILTKRPASEQSNKPAIAIVYAEGVIVDGGGGSSILSTSENVGSDDIRVAMRMAERDPNIKAIVLRIDSPGGSALASEVMWQAVHRVAQTKPVIVSIGSMAASGGYYLASSGNYIFADSTGIVGSIGVVGGKLVLKGLFDKVGLTTQNFMRGKNADLFDETTEWTDEQRRQVTSWMHDTYDLFTQRVMSTRGKDGGIKDIDAVARGRIFSAQQGRDLGLVDRLGGLKDAIAYAAQGQKLADGDYDVKILPPQHTLADVINGMSGAESPISPKIDLTRLGLEALPSNTRRALEEQLQVMMVLQKHPVALVAPFVVMEK